MSKFKPAPTVHCHPQSLDSGSTIEDFIKRELELGTGHITCTDHGFMGACRDVYDLAKKNKLTAALGIEIYHRSDDCQILIDSGIAKDKITEYYKYGHSCLWCLDEEAYLKTIKLLSDRDHTAERHGSERKPIFTWEDLEYLGQYNVAISSGCLVGICGRHLKSGNPEIATKYYEKARSLVKPGNFYVEISPHKCDYNWINACVFTDSNGNKLSYYDGKTLRTEEYEEIKADELVKLIQKGKPVGRIIAQRHYRKWHDIETPFIPTEAKSIRGFEKNECSDLFPNGDLQEGLNRFVINLAKKYGDPIVVGDDSHHAYPEGKDAQTVKLNTMGDNFKFYGTYHRYSSEELYQNWKETLGMSEKEFEEILDNTINWAARFKDFKFNSKPLLPKSFYPENTVSHVKTLIDKHGRMDWSNQEMVIRLKTELELFNKNGTLDLLPYFFLAEEVADTCIKNKMLTGVGRGSAGGSLLAYLLNITHLNPLEYNLSLDRFLTLDRIASGKLPDIDSDFSDRTILIGGEKEILEVTFEDGTIKTYNLDDKIKTNKGIKSIEDAFNEGLDVFKDM